MGNIRQQSIVSSIFIYLGFCIGAINVLILFPHFLKPEEFGLTRLLLDISLLISTLSSVGTIPITLKFYPFYKSYLKEKNNDLAFIAFALLGIGLIIFLIGLAVFKEFVIRKFGYRSPLFVSYYYLLYPLTASLALFGLLEAFAWSSKQTGLSNFLKEIGFRVLTLVLLILIAFSVINLKQFLNFYACTYIPSVLILFIYLIKKKYLRFTFRISSVTKRFGKKMATFGGLFFFSAALNVLARTNDIIIISSQSKGGLADAAVFTIATYLITIMDVPQRSLISTTTSHIAEAWKNKDLATINKYYRKTALNLLIIGIAIFGIVFINVPNLVSFLGNRYSSLSVILFILGISKVIDLGTGLNTQILLLSKYWSIDFYTNALFVALSIPLNYFLIKKFGIVGSAVANLISLTVFNVVRIIFIKRLFNLLPFGQANFISLLVGATCVAICILIPRISNIYLDFAVRSVCFILMFGLLTIGLNISSDITSLFYKYYSKMLPVPRK
jgi:O-antigen/teichoic acid export membrane protein